MKKICFLLMSLGILHSSSFALNQVSSPANYSNSAIVDMSANPKPPLALTSLPRNFPFGVTGMQDNDFQSIARGKKEGATVQYVVPNKAFVDDKTDIAAMTAQLNYM